MSFHTPLLLAGKLLEYQGQQNCLIDTLLADEFLAIHFVLYYIPLVLLAILYSIILIKLKTQKGPGEQSVNAEEQREKKG